MSQILRGLCKCWKAFEIFSAYVTISPHSVENSAGSVIGDTGADDVI